MPEKNQRKEKERQKTGKEKEAMEIARLIVQGQNKEKKRNK